MSGAPGATAELMSAVPMIMDVGMHSGKDAQFYLAKGFRVVAIEARPDLVAANCGRFAGEIQSGLLEIIHCAVAETDGTAPFWVFPGKDDWGTLDRRYAQRNINRGQQFYIIEVPCRPFTQILECHGIPYYLKIDIEGADMLCVRALHRFSQRPTYVSLELTMSTFDEAFEGLAQLYSLGYRRFKIVNQALNPYRCCPSPALEGDYTPMAFDTEMSGPFGEEAPGDWCDAESTLAEIRHILKVESLFSREGRFGRFGWIYNGIACRIGREPTGWYDLHAG